MIRTLTFHAGLTDKELQKIGELVLIWAGTEHMLGNALRVILRLSEEEAIALVYPMGLQSKLHWIYKVGPARAKNPKTLAAIDELKAVMEYTQTIRNTVIHGILMGGYGTEPIEFHLRSKERSIPKEDVWAAEEITDYAAIIAAHLNWSLADPDKIPPDLLHAPLPDRPSIPGLPSRPSPTGKK
ncbi:MAG: hypothetical protein ACLQME_09715 [Alphaproteobacteria bacterium]